MELLKYKKSIIVTDVKGEIYRKTNTLFRENKYVVKVLNLKDLKHSDRWNPLGENQDETDIQTSSNVIIAGTQKKRGKDFPEFYRNFLRDTGRMTVDELISKHIGLDATKEDFWNLCLDQACGYIKEFKTLVNSKI